MTSLSNISRQVIGLDMEKSLMLWRRCWINWRNSLLKRKNGPSVTHSAAIVSWDAIWSNFKAELSEREAAIIWTMWLNPL